MNTLGKFKLAPSTLLAWAVEKHAQIQASMQVTKIDTENKIVTFGTLPAVIEKQAPAPKPKPKPQPTDTFWMLLAHELGLDQPPEDPLESSQDEQAPDGEAGEGGEDPGMRALRALQEAEALAKRTGGRPLGSRDREPSGRAGKGPKDPRIKLAEAAIDYARRMGDTLGERKLVYELHQLLETLRLSEERREREKEPELPFSGLTAPQGITT